MCGGLRRRKEKGQKSKNEVTEQFGRKMNQGVDENRNLVLKEMSKVDRERWREWKWEADIGRG